MKRLRLIALLAVPLVLPACLGAGAPSTAASAHQYEYMAPNQPVPEEISARLPAGYGPEDVVMQVIPGTEGWCWYYRTSAGAFEPLDTCVG